MSATDAHPAAEIDLPKHEFLAGRIALDFCNSLSPARRVALRDRIVEPADFTSWAKRAGIVLDRAPSPQALARLRRLRAALIGIFHALAEHRAPREGDLALLNTELAEARAAERIVATKDGYAIGDSAPAAIDRLRHRIARDAGDLLTGDLRRIKRCPAHDCHWLFHDDSKNLSRRWCAMDDCGTKDKVRRYRERASA
ncbi:CGNR zinc finger domain-containing protein [Dongia deserti]|uniref:CGNR zinc finger domain-containing protein n=1 Tax=Dongia deserti TaxID=2268030 RepID=UPI000E64E130|nr:ABATE domain-containing protein [Dongia deserti]